MARKVVYDFERPLVELEEKLEELKKFSADKQVDVTDGIDVLQKRIATTRKDVYTNLTPWQRVQLARHPDRPYTLDYLQRICTDFIELKGDRRYADDEAMLGGFAKIDGRPVMIIGQQKGRNLKENVRRNFGCVHPEGYRKALRLMKLADKAGVPIITFIDTPGAYPGIASEERHIGEAIAVNLQEMFRLRVPIVSIVIGEGGSGGALGIGIGNRLLLMDNAYYSVITPEGCAAILWKDDAAKERAAEALKLTSYDLLKNGIIDEIIPEPEGGAHQDMDAAADLVKTAILEQLDQLTGKDAEVLKTERYRKFREIGVYCENGETVGNHKG
jgi:acetyl-CoA carboxylase carboxyl transferase subunit alpha